MPALLLHRPAGAKVRFCPRCGLAIRRAAADTSPLELMVGPRTFKALDRIAIGPVCTYIVAGSPRMARVEGVLGRSLATRCSNPLWPNEAANPPRPAPARRQRRFTPFLRPSRNRSASATPRPAPRGSQRAPPAREHPHRDELYTLDEVAPISRRPEQRHAAWIGGGCSTSSLRAHALGPSTRRIADARADRAARAQAGLIDWCLRRPRPERSGRPDHDHRRRTCALVQARRRDAVTRRRRRWTFSFAARCIIELLGETAGGDRPPPTSSRVHRTCSAAWLAAARPATPTAWKLLDDFRLIDASGAGTSKSWTCRRRDSC